MEIKKFSRLSILLALSVSLNILESLIPFFNGYIPGIKLGLANIISLYVLYKFSLKDAFYLGILRVFLVSILRTGIFSTYFFFSLSGAILSIIMMHIGMKYLKLSVIGVSILGSIFHSIGQILVAIILLHFNMIYYLPWILLISIPSGILTGIISNKLIKRY